MKKKKKRIVRFGIPRELKGLHRGFLEHKYELEILVLIPILLVPMVYMGDIKIRPGYSGRIVLPRLRGEQVHCLLDVVSDTLKSFKGVLVDSGGDLGVIARLSILLGGFVVRLKGEGEIVPLLERLPGAGFPERVDPGMGDCASCRAACQ